MDGLDRNLLQLMQDAFPLVSRPWAEIGRNVGIGESEVLARVRELIHSGILKRVGPVLDARKIGLTASSLIGMKVPSSSLEEVAKRVSTFREVTHNYERGHEYNLWFTLVTRDEKSLSEALERIRRATGVEDFISLPRSRAFKIDACFRFSKKRKKRRLLHKTEESGKITKEEKRLLKAFQDGIRLVSQPFATVAGMVGKSENDVLSTIKSLLKRGVIRRVGAVVRHRAAGFTANALVAWKVPPETLGDVRGKMARFEEITHCYERLTVPGKWEYNVFCMAHGRSKEECEEVIKRISKEIGIQEYVVLYSGREFKTAGVRVN